MADFPAAPEATTPLFIQNSGIFGGAASGITARGWTSNSWGTANRAFYYPFAIPFPYAVRRVFWGNGSTVTGNKDFGIYNLDGTKIFSTGSTGEAGASGIQYVTVGTPFILPPGSYYMGISCDATTNHGWGLSSGQVGALRQAGVYMQATALPLPDPATFTAITVTVFWFCGITRTASGF